MIHVGCSVWVNLHRLQLVKDGFKDQSSQIKVTGLGKAKKQMCYNQLMNKHACKCLNLVVNNGNVQTLVAYTMNLNELVRCGENNAKFPLSATFLFFVISSVCYSIVQCRTIRLVWFAIVIGYLHKQVRQVLLDAGKLCASCNCHLWHTGGEADFSRGRHLSVTPGARQAGAARCVQRGGHAVCQQREPHLQRRPTSGKN